MVTTTQPGCSIWAHDGVPDHHLEWSVFLLLVIIHLWLPGCSLTAFTVNGIRNPFQYQPWRDKRQFEAMFEILEADIIIFQETKIQRKDLRDDMVLVPGWDCFWSLPRHKKGARVLQTRTTEMRC